MGLDMYWFTEPTKEEQLTDLIDDKDSKPYEIGYFRKYYDLNNFMLDLLEEQIKEDGNCEDLYLDKSHLAAMKKFHNESTDYDFKSTLAHIINKIEISFKHNKKVFYHAWW